MLAWGLHIYKHGKEAIFKLSSKNKEIREKKTNSGNSQSTSTGKNRNSKTSCKKNRRICKETTYLVASKVGWNIENTKRDRKASDCRIYRLGRKEVKNKKWEELIRHSIFGWDLPPGCSNADIERAAGDDEPPCCQECKVDPCTKHCEKYKKFYKIQQKTLLNAD